MPSYSPELLPTAIRHSCGERVRWCHDASGGWVLVDAEPHPAGRVMLVLTPDGWVAETRRPYRAIALRTQGLELYHHHHCEL
jgi:hypothetical protein